MKVLLTGAFGNVGASALRELLQQGHHVRAFDVPTDANRKAARKFGGAFESVWGDIRRAGDVAAAARDREVVVHLAAIIPPPSELRPELARQVNVGGTQNILAAIKAQPKPPRLIYSSSVALFGRDQIPPRVRTAADPIVATDHYTAHKLECEKLIRASGLQWCILRLGAVVPVAVGDLGQTFRAMFECPLGDRIECVHSRDVGLAVANAVQSGEVWGKTLLIAGGPACQLQYREFFGGVLEAAGVGRLPEAAFSAEHFHTHWMDTAESQQLLHYQRFGYDQYLRDVRAAVGHGRTLIRLLRPLIRPWMLKQSPFYQTARAAALEKPRVYSDD